MLRELVGTVPQEQGVSKVPEHVLAEREREREREGGR
jgi:hypothetical protein